MPVMEEPEPIEIPVIEEPEPITTEEIPVEIENRRTEKNKRNGKGRGNYS